MTSRFVEGPLVDHHCHAVMTDDLERDAFEAMLNEAERPSPLATTLFDSMLGLAIRRWSAPVLDLEPLVSPEVYLARRNELGGAEVTRRLMQATGSSGLLVDMGFSPPGGTTPAELAALADAEAYEVVRLEALAEETLDGGVSAAGFAAAVTDRLGVASGADGGHGSAVGAKSIAAYRTGLALPGVKPADHELVAALEQLERQPDGHHRIAHPAIHAWLAWTAIEAGLPLQFHVGYGDKDLDLADCDPLRLTAFLRATEERGVPVMLLHNYPFHRQAAYLAQVFDHVFMDVGLATHNTGALSIAVIRESLELAPFGKMLYSSDAFGLAELYHLGALLFRRGLSSVLGGLVDDGSMTTEDARRIGSMISADNAIRAYRLDVEPT